MSQDIERVRLIGDLAAAFPSLEVTDATIEAFDKGLADVPLKLLRPAIGQCIATAKFFPSVAEIRERVGAMKMDKPAPVNCLRCHGSGMEMVTAGRDDRYSYARRCDHVVPEKAEPPIIADEDADVDRW